MILGLVAAFAGATGGALLALILTPIGAGALVIAPSVVPISQKSAIVDNMIGISNQNKKFNDNLKTKEEKYEKYKQDHPNFLESLKPKSEPENKQDMEENIINTDPKQENKIIPKNDETDKKINSFNITGQNQNGQGNEKNEEKDNQEFE